MGSGKGFAAAALLWLGMAASVQAQVEAPVALPAPPTEGVVRPGDVAVRIPLPPDYRSVRDNAPRIGAVLEASLPTQMRFLDAYYSRSDLTAAILGTHPPEEILMVVATLRDAEALVLNDAVWVEAKPAMARGVAGSDLAEMMESLREGANERLSSTTGTQVDMSLRAVGKPLVYDTDGDAIRFQVRIKVNGQVGGRTSVRDMVMAAAIARVRGKLIYLYLYDAYEGDATAPALREALALQLGKIYAANAGPEPPAEAVAAPAAGD